MAPRQANYDEFWPELWRISVKKIFYDMFQQNKWLLSDKNFDEFRRDKHDDAMTNNDVTIKPIETVLQFSPLSSRLSSLILSRLALPLVRSGFLRVANDDVTA